MSARSLLPTGWAPPIGYANGIEAGPGRIVFIAGQVGWENATRFYPHRRAIRPALFRGRACCSDGCCWGATRLTDSGSSIWNGDRSPAPSARP
jgi:enamine deaminase RidA (YjgF/YER057c/UK114 family)